MTNDNHRPDSRVSNLAHEASSLDSAIATLDLLLTELRTVSKDSDQANIQAIIEDIRCVADVIDKLVQENKK